MSEWYRRKTWTDIDEEQFFAKLKRAHKGGRAQYLKIQGIELAYTGDVFLMSVAETLFNKVLNEYPEDRTERSSALNMLGYIYQQREDYETALSYYKQSLDYEKIFPKVITTSYLDFSELVIKTNQEVYFDFVEDLLEPKLSDQFFPIAKYKMYAFLSVIKKRKGDLGKAALYADLAVQASLLTNSGLRYHQSLGVVKDRDSWIDELLSKK